MNAPLARTTAADGTGIAWEIRGEGPPLVLVAGIGADHTAWGHQIVDLERRFRVLMIDNRGTGESDKAQGPYTTRLLADDVAAVMAAAGYERAHVLGASMGGTIVQELALWHPERIASLAIVCSWAACDFALARTFEVMREMAQRLGPFDPRWIEPVQRFLTLIGFGRTSFEERGDLIRDLEAGVAAAQNVQPWQTFVAQADACLSHDARARLARITAPTLVLAGEEDRFTPLHLSAALADALPNARLRVMEECGHVMFYEQPGGFNDIVMSFFHEQRGAL
jgi:pimeloyl-ACP methyl ester carboxylesterase